MKWNYWWLFIVPVVLAVVVRQVNLDDVRNISWWNEACSLRVILLYLSAVALFAIGATIVLGPNARKELQFAAIYRSMYPSTATLAGMSPYSFPFIAMVEPRWSVLQKSIDTYRIETHHLLEQLSMTLEVVLDEEAMSCSNNQILFSDRIRDKINRLSRVYDKDLEVLQKYILVPFPITFALPSSSDQASVPMERQQDSATMEGDRKGDTRFTWGQWSGNRHKQQQRFTSEKLDRPYDSARQVVAHLVRDWSVQHNSSSSIQSSTYAWCVNATYQHYPSSADRSSGPVLVPGAGLGRLAWELASQQGYRVEAVESSICMAAAAHAIFHQSYRRIGTDFFELHPYAADAFTNEISSDARYETMRFPGVNPAASFRGSLSYTVTEFRYDNMLHVRHHYSAVVTCFFVDTATTVYDYLTTIAMVLAPGGIWVNLGPLHWHFNSQVPVAVDELRLILENFCDPASGSPQFEILHWSVETRPVDYRNSGRSTRLEAYFPLRFVLRKSHSDPDS
jgi:N2227-like protein